MAEVKKYHLAPTALIPNSPYPVLHYPGLLQRLHMAPDAAAPVHDLFLRNGWQPQWVYRYGHTQPSHYHSNAHEAMAVLTGSATIRFGAADHDDPADAGVVVAAHAGDVFVLPAGIAHKTFDAAPACDVGLLTPGDGHDAVAVHDVMAALAGTDGFLMMGAYPVGSVPFDFMLGGEKDQRQFEEVWAVPRPERDPVLGASEEGLCGQWK